MRKIYVNTCITIIFSTIIFLSASSCRQGEYRTAQGVIWNTLYNITYNGDPSLSDSIIPVLRSVENSVSVFTANSLISRINRNETDSTDAILRHIYTASVQVNTESDGAFDPTVAPLINAWGFGKGHTPTSDTLEIEKIKQYTGIGKTRLAGNRLIKDDNRLQFNFSAIAKGYGCDAVAEMFRRNGVEDYMIEIGGEIRAGGVSPRGDSWRISIDAPEDNGGTPVHNSVCVITVDNCGVATSGNYRNYRKVNGKTYGHTIDPVTGRPAPTDVVSATVVANSAMLADAYATAIMAMGSKRASAMIEKLNLPAFIITTNGKTITTPRFDKLIQENKR